MSQRPATILLAEDDDGHAHLVLRNLQRAGITNDVIRVHDGQEALDMVFRHVARPAHVVHRHLLVLLDIKMPRVDGIDVLRHMKGNAKSARIPVIVLTTTDDPREIERCYELGCAVYITKPVDYQLFVEAIQRLGLFLQFITVPSLDDQDAVRAT